MRFPLEFYDISIWLALSSIILLITSELTNPLYGKTNLIIERKRLKNIAIIISIFFLLFAVIKIYQIILTI